MSTEWNGKMGHMLCYGFDAEQNYLTEITEAVVRKQLENTHAVHDELLRRGYAFPREKEVLAENGGELRLPADNARLLREHSHASDWRAAMHLIREAGFYSVYADMAETVDAAHRSGALCLIAHPGRREGGFTFYDPALLDQVRADIPIDGIEVYHPYHDAQIIEAYLGYVRKHNLLMSTGSDCHCMPGRMPMKYRAEVSRDLLERVGIHIQ